ncbi:MAG: type II toxin-antitoxin system HicB family antitoxin [Turicibacter sp.]|nr:type II toxin-antitoxin system HicB family antitoxin [Turicibacter sp.]
MIKDIKYYMELPYTKVVVLQNDKSGRYYAGRVLELKGCHTTGDTELETLENLNEAMECHLETALAYNDPIPEPAQLEDNGDFLNLPQSLYKTLTQRAKTEGISLNQYAVQLLGR